MHDQKFQLSCDTCVDQFKSNLKKNNISYLPMVFIYGDTETHDEFNTIEEYKNFYDDIRLGKLFSTSGVNETVAEEYFNELIKQSNQDIVHLTLSSGLSLTYDCCLSAAEKINKTSPHKVFVVDSLSATQGENQLLIIAQNLRDEGKNAEEVYFYLNEIKFKIHHWFFISDLFHLKRGGRITGIAATVGSMLQMKPMMTISNEGKLEVTEKILGTKKSVHTLVNKLLKYQDVDFNSPIIICHSDSMALANELKQMILNHTPNANVIINYIGPVIGSHTGPEALGITFVGKEKRVK
ncbi:MAG: DegV family protein [Clostridia bacterium]